MLHRLTPAYLRIDTCVDASPQKGMHSPSASDESQLLKLPADPEPALAP